MVDITEISAMVAAAGVLIGVILTVLQLRDLVKTRQSDLLMGLYSTYSSEEFREMMIEVMNLQFKDYEDYVKTYGSWFSKGPVQKRMAIVGLFFEGVGVLLYRKAIDTSFVFDLFGSIPIILWDKIKPIALGVRTELGEPMVFERFEYLYKELNRRKQSLQQASKKA